MWKKLKEFPNFEINQEAVVRSIANKQIKAAYSNKLRRGYMYIRFRTRNIMLHRLVAETFIPNNDNFPVVHHQDFDVTNNNVSNLEWTTHKGNSEYSKNAGRMFSAVGEKCGNSKLKNKQVILIKKDLKDKKLTYKEIALKYETNYSNIAHIARGSRWGHLQ